MIFKEIDNMKDVGDICHYFRSSGRLEITKEDVMANKLELSANMVNFLCISASTSLADALKAIGSANRTILLVGDAIRAQTLITGDNLNILGIDQNKALSEIIDLLPPLLCVDIDVKVLEIEDLVYFALLLHGTRVPGIAVFERDKIIGIIPRISVVQALPLDPIAEFTKGIFGIPDQRRGIFTCSQCKPPMFKMPLQGTPTCPIHGQMKRVNSGGQ